MAKILVADDEAGLREFITDTLELDEHTVVTAKDGKEAAKFLDERGFDLVLTDLKMPGLDGMGLLRKVRAEQPEVEVIVMTAHGTVDNAVEAMKLGAFEYLQKPISGPDELRLLVSRAVERRGLKDRVDGTERFVEPSGPPLTYGDPAMGPVVEAIEKVARTAATVILLGESGTGKEVAARAIHNQSPRTTKPFMAINCAALSEQLLESELFG
ncbi:MAG: response regulator, partial [Kofleriaceae bacterium]